MADKQIEWTNQQLRAITARGSDVLVSASAGTGKTAVLSGRCVEIVSDETMCPDVSGILVLTFTDAAADQMRSRIRGQLLEAFLKNHARHLRRQLVLLQGADISTIHSFCKRLITEYFYKLGLDPTFRVIDADEQSLLKAEVLDKTIDWAWQQTNLAQGLGELLYRRNLRTNDGFLTNVIAISDFLDGVVSRQNWYERTVKLAEAVDPLTTELGEQQKNIIGKKLKEILERVRYAQKLYENQTGNSRWSEKWQETFGETISKCIQHLSDGNWPDCAEQIRSFEQPARFEYKPRDIEGPVAEVIAEAAHGAKEDFERLSDLAVLNPDYINRVGASSALQTKILVELVKKFDCLYSQAKLTLNCLDFADLEHYALRLLSEHEPSPEDLSPSQTALALRERYKYIFVDEYQDINSVQKSILDLLTCGDNVFVVGDVKQSIYAWRGAEPNIFLRHLASASSEPSARAIGLRVDLNANFRSAKGILDFVNKVFERIMTVSFADINYDESAKLKPAIENKSKTASGAVVEFHILGKQQPDANKQGDRPQGKGDKSGITTSRQRQAVLIAQRIRQMVGAETAKAQFQVYDKHQDKSRDVEYRDIVVLMRSLAGKADFIETLRLAGVPVSCDAIAGYFETTEICDVLCLLKVLDNPQRDIELAAVLRSPFFKITDTELARIRLNSRNNKQDGNLYNSVSEYCVSGPDKELAGKVVRTLERIEQWRTIARRGNLAELIWQIYRETGFLSFVSALPNGLARRANLLKLHDRAIQFEGFASSTGIASLTRFVAFIEKLQELGQDWAPAEPDSSAENTVRVISVHKSKGLEFPVVFLAELNSKFNKRDTYGDCLSDPHHTLGLQIIDHSSNSKLSCLAHQVIAEQREKTRLAEEMRILYVAMTRARERLILTAAENKKHCQTILRDGFLSGGPSVAQWQLRSCKSPLDWLLYGLSGQRSLHTAFETDLAEEKRDDNLFNVRVYNETELLRFSKDIESLRKSKAKARRPKAQRPKPQHQENTLLSQIKQSLAWRYSFSAATSLPAKRSVTQLTHSNDEYVRYDYSHALEQKPQALPGQAVQLAPVQAQVLGTATHLVIAGLDLTRAVTEESIEQTKQKLLAAGAITPATAEHIRTESIKQFFEGELGRIVLDPQNTIRREWPFTFAMPACEFIDSSSPSRPLGDEAVIVQGIIDMLVHTARGSLVIDFKTDRISADQAAERAEFYRRQLELYGRAAAGILKEHTVGKWLYFLTPGRAIGI